ncbi:MAG: SDR family oxidoreductase [Lachnospiraceae bacterium]|nr:SDR family oxidoreductase [Lachnospiraceae bacterium]
MKTVLITGATSGIGEAFAKYYSKKGYRLILTGRNRKRLKWYKNHLKGVQKVIPADLTRKADCKKLLLETRKEPVDIFINNAGFGLFGEFLKTDLNNELSMIQVNDVAMHQLFKVMLRRMERRGEGTILNVASSAGLLPAGPYMATYYATKAYVVSLTKAVAAELKASGSRVYVAALCPGPVDTGFHQVAGVKFSSTGISASQCVKEAVKGMKKKKCVIVPGKGLAIWMKFQKLVPERILLFIIAAFQKSKEK